MQNTNTKLKRTLGFAPAFGAAVGLVVSGTAMFSVGNLAGTAGYATFIAAAIALVPMMAAAFAFGELAAMLPGGGMISDYTLPALGKFWAMFSLLSGYILLIACDGGTQIMMGGASVESITGIPQVAVALALFCIVVVINVVGVGVYGSVESWITVALVVVFALLGLAGVFHVGELFGAQPVGEGLSLVPAGGWPAVFGSVGAAIWFFIGFEFACPMAQENKKPFRNIPWALILGLLVIFAVDSIFAFAATRYTDAATLATSATPQIDAAQGMMGAAGGITMTVLTVLASFTTANAYCAALPRMLYGMAREGLMPKVFLKLSKRFRTPVYGIAFTGALMMVTIVYIGVNGTNAATVSSLISVACITWMISYAIAMIDVLVLRRRYPDFPRLWKAPAAKITLPIGIVGVVYAIWTLSDYWIAAGIAMLVVAVYVAVWMKAKGINPWERTSMSDTARAIKASSEPLPVWDEAVEEWLAKHRMAGREGASDRLFTSAANATGSTK